MHSAYDVDVFLCMFFRMGLRYQTGGSILAGRLALDRGWSINLGGGFHHSSKSHGGGFCPYADISLLIKFLLNYEQNRVSKVMIVDLDAHQVGARRTRKHVFCCFYNLFT